VQKLGKSTVLSVAFLVGAVVSPNTHAQYRPPTDARPSVLPPYASQASGAPPPSSWYYDPYTNGSTTCPQGGENLEPKCNILIPPSTR
jgi:hypothetical protein